MSSADNTPGQSAQSYLLSLRCPDRLGVVARYSGVLYERGVKVIGATAHFVTSDLDEGPIIAQEVRAIDHEILVEQMVHLGHDTEATALSHAVRLFCEQRVLLNGQRTVIL